MSGLYQAKFYGLSESELEWFQTTWGRGIAPGGVLFLRPLDFGRTIYLKNQFDPSVQLSPLSTDPRFSVISLEGALAQVVFPFGKHATALGGIQDIIGMRRSHVFSTEVESGLDWRMYASTLLDLSDVIFVLPNFSEPIKWEISEIRKKGVLPQCIFILLPASHEWVDFGNRRAFSEFLKIPSEQLRDEGGFLFGDTDPLHASFLEWSALWNGTLFERIAQRLRSSPTKKLPAD